jgi:hypothetical protein
MIGVSTSSSTRAAPAVLVHVAEPVQAFPAVHSEEGASHVLT